MTATAPVRPLDDPASRGRVQPSSLPPPRRRNAPWADPLFAFLAHGAAWLTLALLAGIIGSLVISFILLAPSIVLGYAVKAAEREDAERGL